MLLTIGIGWDGRRSILAIELANRESRSSWREFLLQLRARGLSGVEFVVSDDTPVSGKRSSKSCRKRPCNAATCISCATRSTMCRARLTTTACVSCAGCTTGATY